MASNADPLASAKAALGKAKGFTRSVEGTEPSRFAPKPTAPAPKPAAPKPELGLGAELANKQRNVDEYAKANNPMPKMHKGGIISGKKGKEVVVKVLAGEKVLPLEKSKATKMKTAADVLGGAKREGKMREPEKDKTPKKTKVKEMHIRRAENGGYISKHDMESPEGTEAGKMAEGPKEHIHKSLHALISAVKEHMAEEKAEGSEEAASETPADEAQEQA